MGQPYDPMVFTIAKWWLFAGWMMNPAENNDKDLNVVRSAINRYMEDNGRERPVLGFSVAQVIKVFKMKMEDAKRERGEEVGLNRVPCPEAALLRVFELGEVVEGLQLRQVACQLLQLLGWFRAATVAGMQAGDVWFDANGNLNIWARHVKMRPELKEQPALLTIPPGTGYRHVRCRAFRILQRAFDRVPGWPTYLSSQVPPGRDDGACSENYDSRPARVGLVGAAAARWGVGVVAQLEGDGSGVGCAGRALHVQDVEPRTVATHRNNAAVLHQAV